MPKVEGMRIFVQGTSKLKGQWMGKGSHEVVKHLLPVLVGQQITFNKQTPARTKMSKHLNPDLAGLAHTILKFSYCSHASQVTEEDISKLEQVLEEIYQSKVGIVWVGLFEDHSQFDDIPKLHMLSHYTEFIHKFGTLDNYSTEAPEYLHINCTKQGWWTSTTVQPTPQMVKYIQQYEALHIQLAHMKAWLRAKATNKQTKQKWKSCVVFGEEVKGLSFWGY
ncbi:hypothetical protein FRC08_017604 [Ceratobasidium sp. 394]|nr:hypothetical protein FRC08_017604 [Ceratobasidium sp. 394]